MDHRGLLLARGPGPGDLALGHDRGHGRRGDRLAVLVHHEAAVGIPVEREADVGAVLPDGLLQVHQVGGLQRVGRVVGERAVQLEV